MRPEALAADPLPDVDGRVVTVSETGAEKSAGEAAAIRVAVIAGESWLLGTIVMCGEDGEGSAWYC